MATQNRAHIYDILTTHDIPLSKEDIAWAFDSSKTAAELDDYAQKYLVPECFLSLEEAEIYEHIKETHLLKLHKSRDLSAVNPHTNDYLRLEIERLKKSTESYKKNTEILKRQRAVLDGLNKQAKQVEDNRRRLRERRRKKWLAEREKVIIEIDNLVVTLRHQIHDLQTEDSQKGFHSAGASSNVADLNSLRDLLASDDKILKRLERLVEETNVGDLDGSKEQKLVDKVRLMTDKLSDLLTAVVRTRLDRVYLEELGCPKEWTFVRSEEENHHINALQRDLEGLDAEIPAVSKMSTEGEFLRPVLGEVKKRNAQLVEAVEERGRYVCEVLQYLQKRIQYHIQILEKDLYKRKALNEISSQLELIAQSPLPKRIEGGDGNQTPPNESSNSIVPRTPGRASSSPTKHLPIHLRRPNAPETPKRATRKYRSPRKRRDTNDDDDDDDEESGEPEIDLLLHLGINLPAHLSGPQTPGTPFGRDVPGPDISSAETLKHLLKQYNTMNNRVLQQEAALEKTVRGVIASSIAEANNLNRIATEALWINKPFGKGETVPESTLGKLIPPGLVSEGIIRKSNEVEKEVEKLSAKMEKVASAVEVLEESDGAGLGVGAVEAKLRFVRRWGR